MKILVTGGAGFVGSNLIKTLLKEDNQIISLDNYSTGSNQNEHVGVRYINGNTWDILDNPILQDFKPNIIFHFGEYSRIHQSFKEPEKVFKSNFYGTQQVLQYANKNDSFLIYSGSSAIFGNKDNPNLSPYSFTKSKNIELIHNYGRWYGLKFAICYFYNVYGPGQISTGDYATVIGIFERQYKNSEELTIVKPGTQLRCFTHIDDIIRGILLVVKNGRGDGYLLGNRQEYSIFDVAKMFNTPYKLLEERKGERYNSTIDINNKSEIELGWKPTINLKDYIESIL
jgi:UDP-glucose 4-epimerase